MDSTFRTVEVLEQWSSWNPSKTSLPATTVLCMHTFKTPLPSTTILCTHTFKTNSLFQQSGQHTLILLHAAVLRALLLHAAVLRTLLFLLQAAVLKLLPHAACSRAACPSFVACNRAALEAHARHQPLTYLLCVDLDDRRVPDILGTACVLCKMKSMTVKHNGVVDGCQML